MNRTEFLQRFYLHPQPQVTWPLSSQSDSLRPSAVLVALQETARGLDIILTRRATHLRFHAQQICFAGGRSDTQDKNLLATALREAREEIGVQSSHIDVIAPLPPQPVLTRFMIHPYLAFIDRNAVFTPDPREVQEIIRVPVHFALQHTQHFVQPIERDLYQELVFIPFAGQVIWGATAAIIRRLADHIHPAQKGLYRPVR